MLALSALTPAAPAAASAGAIVAIMSMAFALGAWARAGLYCNHQDLSPKYAGALLGELGGALGSGGRGRVGVAPHVLRCSIKRCSPRAAPHLLLIPLTPALPATCLPACRSEQHRWRAARRAGRHRGWLAAGQDGQLGRGALPAVRHLPDSRPRGVHRPGQQQEAGLG